MRRLTNVVGTAARALIRDDASSRFTSCRVGDMDGLFVELSMESKAFRVKQPYRLAVSTTSVDAGGQSDDGVTVHIVPAACTKTSVVPCTL